MRFVFTFEKLLDHKRKLEDMARRDWHDARAKVDESSRRLNQLYVQIDEARTRAGLLSRMGGAAASALAQIDEFINGQKIRIERHRADLRVLMSEAERLQEILIEAAKERKTLAKLKERRQEEHRLLRKKKELKEVDELVVTRFRHQKD